MSDFYLQVSLCFSISPSGFWQAEYRNAAGMLQECCMNTAGILHEYCMTTAGILHEYCRNAAQILDVPNTYRRRLRRANAAPLLYLGLRRAFEACVRRLLGSVPLLGVLCAWGGTRHVKRVCLPCLKYSLHDICAQI